MAVVLALVPGRPVVAAVLAVAVPAVGVEGGPVGRLVAVRARAGATVVATGARRPVARPVVAPAARVDPGDGRAMGEAGAVRAGPTVGVVPVAVLAMARLAAGRDRPAAGGGRMAPVVGVRARPTDRAPVGGRARRWAVMAVRWVVGPGAGALADRVRPVSADPVMATGRFGAAGLAGRGHLDRRMQVGAGVARVVGGGPSAAPAMKASGFLRHR